MPEYISREAAQTIIERLRDKCGNDEMAFALNWASRLIRDTPAADVVEVRHGEWIIQNSLVNRVLLDENEVFACSACQEQRTRRKYNYCPNCGAKMDGKSADYAPKKPYDLLYEDGGPDA